MNHQLNLFVGDDERMQMTDSIAYTQSSMIEHATAHRTWVAAWSGGKDSTAMVTVLAHLMDAKKIPRPERLIVCYADTRQELLPLYEVAEDVIQDLEERGIDVRRVMAPIDERFMVYMLGYGVPPPHNRFRWCTDKLKVRPMGRMMEQIRQETGAKPLLLHGVRRGESAARDQRIVAACSLDDAECGQGWYEQTPESVVADKLGPILAWRACHVWEWLDLWAPRQEFGGWETSALAQAYGLERGQKVEALSARTGCVACPLVTEDRALNRVLRLPAWSYLTPLSELQPLYRLLRDPGNRLRKERGELTESGRPVSSQERMGPLTMAAREMALERVLDVQRRINEAAARLNRPRLDLLNDEEVARIRELIAANTWPKRWTGTEPTGDRALMTLFDYARDEVDHG